MIPIEINDLGSIGAVRDTPPYMLPPEAFTQAINMRSVDGGLEALLGWTQVFGTPGVAPHFIVPIQTSSTTFWLYVSLTKAYGYDGTTHTEVTRAAGDYTATDTHQWNGTLLGGVPILNNGIDVPQAWLTPALATDLVNLTNWPATLRAKIVRAFGPFLMAFNVTKSGTNYPHMCKWSHPADPGSVPSSWDETDQTKDTGEKDLPDVDSGLIVDALPLADTMYVYKETSVWKVRFIGGRLIFDFGQSAWLPTTGCLAARCVAITGDGTKHVFATQDDIVWHDGNRVRSILNERQRSRLFNEIDTVNYVNSFMFCNPQYKEMWFCYPSSGATHPDKALIMNYGRGSDAPWPITEADGITFRHAATGPIEGAADEDWEANENEWEVDDGPWSTLERRRTVVAGTDATKFYLLDSTNQRAGVAFNALLQREGLSVLGKKRNGEWIVDFDARKLADLLWPKIQGGPVNIRLGSQELVDGPISWGTAVEFNPSTLSYVNAGPKEGRALAIEIESDNNWRIDGLRMEIENLGIW